MFCLANFSIDGIPSIFNSVVAKELMNDNLALAFVVVLGRTNVFFIIVLIIAHNSSLE